MAAARQACPDVVIVLGEDLTRFRNVSKILYDFLAAFAWSKRAERLGFDEVFLDVTDMVSYNIELLNVRRLADSFFHLSRTDPTLGFAYDASSIWGHTSPAGLASSTQPWTSPLHARLLLGSHLAQHMRHKLEECYGYTSTVGISTSKLLSKLVGNCNKPKGQTTLVPPYTTSADHEQANVTRFIDSHDIGKIPGIGFKLAQKIRGHVLGRTADFDRGLVYGATKEAVTVRDVRLSPGMGPETLDHILAGAGAPRDVGLRVWGLLNGVDDAAVELARKVPRQISIEDSYLTLDTIERVTEQLLKLSKSLLRRMRMDLLEDEREGHGAESQRKRWLAHPRTLRLSTRLRPPLNPDGSRSRTFHRMSRSGPMPQLVFSTTADVDTVAAKLLHDALLPQFRRLHPERTGWDLTLVNVAATNIVEAAVDERDGMAGADRDIQRMFSRQDHVLKDWKVDDIGMPPDEDTTREADEHSAGSRVSSPAELADEGAWQEDEGQLTMGPGCPICGAVMPAFAMAAHERYHQLDEE